MAKTFDFQGFSEPKENFYRLPNEWFDFWIFARRKVGSRFATLLKVLEYVLVHTWGDSKFDGYVQLSANEIYSGRRSKKNTRMDEGVGVSENAVRKAAHTLAKLGALNVHQDKEDGARKMRTYQPNLKKEKKEGKNSDGVFEKGFKKPTTNYFKVPKNWIDTIRKTGSAAVILSVEYLFRHAWGYQNEDGAWLTAEEIANGRKYSDGKLQRYDNGTGFALETIQRALGEAALLGLVVWKEQYEKGIVTRLYNLRFQGMKSNDKGKLLEDDENTNEVVSDDDYQISANANDTSQNAIDEVTNTIEDAKNVNEERSLKDTSIDTISRHEIKTPPSSYRKEKSKRTPAVNTARKKKHPSQRQSPPPRRQPDNGDGGGGGGGGDDEKIILPEDLLTMLEEMGWSDTASVIEKEYAQDSNQVIAWAKYTLQKDGLTNRAGYFRKRLLSGEKAPALPKTKDPGEDRNRYTSGKYAEFLD